MDKTNTQTQAEPISAEEMARRLATVRNIMKSAGLHKCPNAVGVPEYCGCAPGRCDALRKGRS